MRFFSRFKPRPSRSHHLGLIIQGHGLGVVEMGWNENHPNIQWCEFRPCLPGEEREVFQSLLKQRKIKKAECRAVLPMDRYEVFVEEMVANIPREEQADALRWNIVERLEYTSAEAMIASFEQPSPPRSGSRQMAYVIATRKEQVQANINAFHQRGRTRLVAIDIHELALRNLAALLPEEKEGVAMLHLRSRDGLLTVTRDHTLYLARKMDIGLDAIFSFLDENRGDGSVEQTLAQCSLLDELCTQVQSTLDYYLSRFMPHTIERLYLAPMERPLPELRAAISDRLAVRVKSVNLAEMIDFSGDLPDESTLGKLFPAIGVALAGNQGDAVFQQEVNLFDPELLPKMAIASAEQIVMVAAGLLVLAGVSAGGLYWQYVRSGELLATEKARLAQMEAKVGALGKQYPVQKVDAALEQHLAQIEGTILMKKLIVQILEGSYDFGNTTGFSGYFRELAQNKLEGVWISRMRILNGGEQFGLYGQATDPKNIPAMVSLFQNGTHLSGHPFSLIKMEKNGLIEFSLLTHSMDEKTEGSETEKNSGLLQSVSPFSFLMENFVEKALSGIIGKN